MTSPLYNILIVDDTPANLTVLANMLTQEGYKVRPAINGEVALRAVQSQRPDLILLDIRLPDMDGYEVCQRLKADPSTQSIPVLFISALDEIEDKMRAFQVGGVDYITKPFQLQEVLARVQTHLLLEERRRQIEQLLEKKDEILQIVSHDLKNPLGVIIGYADLLQFGGIELQTATESIIRTARFMQHMVLDLLEIALAEGKLELKLKQQAINHLLKEVFEAYNSQAREKQQRFTWDSEAPDVLVLIDALRFRQVISNLLSNAIKYTPPGGQVHLGLTPAPDHVRITVADTGLGIPADALSHLFQKFYRVQSKAHLESEGTGLGLAIVKTIVEQHGGQIEVESQLGQGTTFTVYLPIS
jgi:signal transduction histidine kinase